MSSNMQIYLSDCFEFAVFNYNEVSTVFIECIIYGFMIWGSSIKSDLES
jgi:hypothetical protein